MPVEITDDARELLEDALPFVLGTLRKDGSPHQTVIWFRLDGDHIVLNAEDREDAGSIWLANVRRDPRVSFIVLNNTNMMHYIAGRGRVVSIEDDPDYKHIDIMARLYDGTDRYEWSRPGQGITKYKVTIEPESIRLSHFEPPEPIQEAMRNGLTQADYGQRISRAPD